MNIMEARLCCYISVNGKAIGNQEGKVGCSEDERV